MEKYLYGRKVLVTGSGRQKIVASETLVFFLLPMVIPLVLSLPISEVCAMVYRLICPRFK